jgi:hypothetical protein
MLFLLWAGVLMPYNGPAIKGGCVPADGGVARFLESWYKLSGLYEGRDTNELNEKYYVTIEDLYKWVLVQCRGTNLQRSQKFIMIHKV